VGKALLQLAERDCSKVSLCTILIQVHKKIIVLNPNEGVVSTLPICGVLGGQVFIARAEHHCLFDANGY